MTFQNKSFYPGLGSQGPTPENINNGILYSNHSEPPKNINSESGGDYAMYRQIYARQYPILKPIILPNKNIIPTKKWTPNSNRDASSIASRNRFIEMGKSTLAVDKPQSYQTHSINVNRNTILEAKNRCRNKGYRAPPKVTNSPFNTTTFYGGLPKKHLKPPSHLNLNTCLMQQVYTYY